MRHSTRIAGSAAALAAICSGGAANAQSAQQAFECTAPYEAAMESLAALEVTGQGSSPENTLFLQRASETVEFAPGSLKVFGVSPTTLSLMMEEPLSTKSNGTIRVSFIAGLPADAALDEAIKASQTWHLGVCAFGLCIRDRNADPDGAGSLEYRRVRDASRTDQTMVPDKVACVFEFTQEELDNLGS